MSQVILDPLPAVALVFDQTLQHGDGGRFATLPAERDVAQKRSDPGEVGGLGQEAADLSVWILAGLETSKELQDEFVAIKNRCVGLLRRPRASRKRIVSPNGREGTAAAAMQNTGSGA